jgi:hypothetical protein
VVILRGLIEETVNQLGCMLEAEEELPDRDRRWERDLTELRDKLRSAVQSEDEG